MKRIYHPWNKWECYKAGFFNTTHTLDKEECQKMYCEFLRDSDRFENAIERVFKEWPVSCEQFLSNDSMNRIAWIGQSSMCIETGIPATYRGGFRLLSEPEQNKANNIANTYLIRWIRLHEKEDKQIYFDLE